MTNVLKPHQFFLTLFATVVVVFWGGSILPHNDYIKFQVLTQSSVHFLRAQWIYERIHFDSTPIDVAFIGTSHTQSGIDSERVEQSFQKHIHHPIHVVNFALPQLGRDLHYAVVRELLSSRAIKTLVIEVQEGESRAPHPLFWRLADARDILNGPWVINADLLSMMAEFPLRQTQLFLKSSIPALFDGMQTSFNPAKYEGAHWNDTWEIHGFNEVRTIEHTEADFDAEVKHLTEQFNQKQALGQRLTFPVFSPYSLLYRYNFVYLEKIIKLAQAKNVRILFLYLPFFHGPEKPIHEAFLESHGTFLNPQKGLLDARNWQNAEHLNVYGARWLSDWMGHALAIVPEATLGSYDIPIK